MKRLFALLAAGAALALCAHPSAAQRIMEKLDRGVVAVNQGDGKVFVSWRVFGTDPADVAFNLYRASGSGAPAKLNTAPITGATNYQDSGANLAQGASYTVRAVIGGQEQPADKGFALAPGAPARNYISIPLKQIPGFQPNDASTADLDGDGQYEIILHQVSGGQDNSRPGVTGTPVLQAYKLDGTMMWQINLGINVRDGAHYTQFMVYDLDGDGRAEMVCRTADGSWDGTGKAIGDATKDYRNENGFVLKGPEYVTVFDGKTGAALASALYEPQRAPDTDSPSAESMTDIWGDANGNRIDRFLGTIAYLDGERPSVVFGRGYYTGRAPGGGEPHGRTVIAAWDWRDGKLTNRWVFDARQNNENKEYIGQGAHNLTVGDVDGDGKDEIVYGAMTVDDNGKGLFSMHLGHGDAEHLSDMDPSRPGLEHFMIHENPRHVYGAEMHDAKTGEILVSMPGPAFLATQEDPTRSPDVGRGVAADIDPRFPGFEMWAAALPGLWNVNGKMVSEKRPRSQNFLSYWDGDLLRETLDQNRIMKWNPQTETEDTIFTAENCVSSNGTKATPALSADILGDWREELIEATQDGSELRIFTTTIPTEFKMYTLMHDPMYRMAISFQNTAYNQPPHLGFYLGPGVAAAPKPNIRLAGAQP